LEKLSRLFQHDQLDKPFMRQREGRIIGEGSQAIETTKMDSPGADDVNDVSEGDAESAGNRLMLGKTRSFFSPDPENDNTDRFVGRRCTDRVRPVD
jgi:hypothetical protein